jgi:hypothetical protein
MKIWLILPYRPNVGASQRAPRVFEPAAGADSVLKCNPALTLVTARIALGTVH